MTTKIKPQLDIEQFRGENVFHLIGSVVKILQRSKLREEADEFQKRVQSECKSYEAVFDLAEEYVDSD